MSINQLILIIDGQSIVQVFVIIDCHRLSMSSESLSIFLDKSGKGKKTLPAASTFRIKHALKI